MAREEEERGVAGRKPLRQLVELVDDCLPSEVVPANDLEAKASERIADGACVVDRFPELLIRRQVVVWSLPITSATRLSACPGATPRQNSITAQAKTATKRMVSPPDGI